MASGDVVEVFRAADASTPVWVSLGSTTLTSSGPQWLTRTYTLPTGSRQAVRAIIHGAGVSGSCPGGTKTDVDDLAFQVLQ